jgi:predicted ATPase/DNA-binding SARP family transcriptional activator
MDFRILGPLEALDEGRAVQLGGTKQRALLALFLLHANELLSTDRLTDELWGEHPAATAAKMVQVYVSRLRKALAGGQGDSAALIVTREHGYELKLDPERLDAHRFERLVAEGRSELAAGRPERAAAALEEALSLWRGPPLADLANEPFAQHEIARIDDLRVAALEQLIDAKLALGAHAEVLGQLETLIGEHPYREHLRAQLMLALYRCDRQGDALQAYQDARRQMVEELGIEPGERLRTLERAILAQDPGLALAAEQPAAGLPALATARHNLPVPLTSFVGRERELGELLEALAATRLLTLTGPGGCGKTRLALRAASELRDRFPGGVWWVELAPVADGQLVGAAVAEALGVRPRPGMTELQAACAYLASRRALVILDNCEHLPDACAEAAAALLQAGSDVVVLAASRAPLGVGGETDWWVPSLSLPGLGAGASSEALAGSDAVSLFVERARKVRPGFSVTDANVESVARVCCELDGMPLAIELAAARVRMLSLEQIAAGVSDRFRLLTGGPRTASERQQTLRASVDWSHNLLSADEQALLRRVAVFIGGFTLDAVERVCAGDGVERERVLDLFGPLVDQSLVIADERDSGVRYRLLETVRQYALERLTEAGEENTLRGRHRDVFLALAQEAGPQLETGRQREWLELLDPEAANLAAAIDWALRSEPALALRFCAALYRWWCARGRFAEAELAHSRSLDACGDREPGLRARVLHGRAYTAIWAGDSDAAEAQATEALTLAEEVGDAGTAARARCELGTALLYPNPRAARVELARAAEQARTAGDDWALVTATQRIAFAYLCQGEHAQATRANDEVAGLAERLGDPFLVARRWLWPAWMAQLDGRFAEARDAIERVRAAVEAIGDPVMEALADVFLAFVDARQGEPEHALKRLERQLERTVKLGTGIVMPWLLIDIAFAELAAGRAEQARGRLEGLVPLVEGRWSFMTSWALCLLAEARRLLADAAAEATALEARVSGEQLGNRLVATWAQLTLGRLAAACGDWMVAQQHALAHLDACAEGGHASYAPGCLDALAEVAAGLHVHEDAVRLFAAAERARAEIGAVRIPPEERHWAGIDGRLREALRDDAYQAARAEGAELSIEDALEWARGRRGARPAAGGRSPPPSTGSPSSSQRARQRRDWRADVRLARHDQDPPSPHLQEARRPQPRRAKRPHRPAR